MATGSPRLTFYQLIDTSVLTTLFSAKLSTVSPEFHGASPERIPVAYGYSSLRLGIRVTLPPPLEQYKWGWGGFQRKIGVLVLKNGKKVLSK